MSSQVSLGTHQQRGIILTAGTKCMNLRKKEQQADEHGGEARTEEGHSGRGKTTTRSTKIDDRDGYEQVRKGALESQDSTKTRGLRKTKEKILLQTRAVFATRRSWRRSL